MHTEHAANIQYTVWYACMYPQATVLLVWGSKQYMQVYSVYNASMALPMYIRMSIYAIITYIIIIYIYINLILTYRLRYVIGCMLYTNSCQFEILQKVCTQQKISELVKQKCQQSSCPQSVSCPKVKQSPPLQRENTQVSSLRSPLPS